MASKTVSNTPVIVDSSVWIDFFHGRLTPKNKNSFIELLDKESVFLTSVIFHELLVGTKTPNEFEYLQDLLSPYPILALQNDEELGFARFGFDMARKGLLGRYTDLSIAYLASKTKCAIWSFDHYFEKLEKKKVIKTYKP